MCAPTSVVILRQHRTIPALRLKHRSGICGTSLAVSALRIMRYCPKKHLCGTMLRIVPHAGPCRNYILSPERLQTKTGPFSGTGKHLKTFGQRMVMVVAISNRGRCAQGNGIGHGIQRQSQDDAAHHINHRMLL